MMPFIGEKRQRPAAAHVQQGPLTLPLHMYMLNWVQLVCVVGACANHLAGERRRARQQEGNNR